MKLIKYCVAATLICLLSPAYAAAHAIIECVDAEGDASFRDICPPGMTVKSRKELPQKAEPEAGPSVEEVAAANPVTLFIAPDCNACDLVRGLLESRNIPFTEKDASADPEIQQELSTITEGPLSVPTIMIGERRLSGYYKSELDSALSGVGYP